MLKVGVISDSHFPNTETIEKNMFNTLSHMKEYGVDLIVFAGDICDQDQKWTYDMFNDIFEYVFKTDRPQVAAVMGNHDYWFSNHKADIHAVEYFKKAFCVDDINFHVVKDGLHFIGVTSDPYFVGDKFNTPEGELTCQKGNYDYIKNWLKNQIKIAEDDNPDIPIFVISHFPPKNTLPGSYVKDNGNEDLYECFKDHPQIISLSGHTHFSLVDEKSIHQRDFTSVNTGSLQCVCCTIIEKPDKNGALDECIDLERLPGDAYRRFPSYLIMDVWDKKVVFHRFFANGGVCGKDWIVEFPAAKRNFIYTDKRFELSVAPYFTHNDTLKVYNLKHKNNLQNNNLIYLVVKIPEYDGRIVGFKYIIKNNSGFIKEGYSYAEIDEYIDAPKVFHTMMFTDLPEGTLSFTVYAVESFGKLSSNCLTATLIID